MLTKIMPELPRVDVSAGITHYRDVLGFQINDQQDDFGVLDREGNQITFGHPFE